MDYERKYKEALERMKSWVRGEHPECFSEAQKAAEFIFPELKEKESDDERIRKGLIRAFGTIGKKDWGGLIVRDVLAWLEKQGEQTQLDYEHADIPQKDFAPIEHKMLNADKVIKWLHDRIQVDEPQVEYSEDGQPLAESFLSHAEARCIAADKVIEKFKKDFGL